MAESTIRRSADHSEEEHASYRLSRHETSELFSLSPLVGGHVHPDVPCANFTLDETTAVEHHRHDHRFSLRTALSYCGPGILTAAAYVDPGNIEADLQAGAYSGYQLLWVMSTATATGFVFQALAIRLGTVTGRDLATNCQQAYSRQSIYLLWTMTQIAIVASDIQEIVGSAVAFRLLFGFPLWLGCLLTGLDTLTFLGLQTAGVRKLEAVFGVFLLTLVVCFFGNFATSQPDSAAIATGLVPSPMSPRVFVQAAGILGAIIMPHNIFLHSALVLSREVDRDSPSSVREATFYYTLESSITLFMSFLVNAAIVSVFANGFYSAHCANLAYAVDGMDGPFACVAMPPASVSGGTGGGGMLEGTMVTSEPCMLESSGLAGTCQPIGLQVAGAPLERMLGGSARIMWAVGLLAAGQTSTVTGTYAGQFVMEGMLQLHLPNWQRVAFTRSVSLVPALAVALIASHDYFAADRLDAWLNVVQMVQLPFALVPLLACCGHEGIMGREFQLSAFQRRAGWALTSVVVSANAYLLHSMLADAVDHSAVKAVALVTVAGVYLAMLNRFMRPKHASSSKAEDAACSSRVTEEMPILSSSNNHKQQQYSSM